MYFIDWTAAIKIGIFKSNLVAKTCGQWIKTFGVRSKPWTEHLTQNECCFVYKHCISLMHCTLMMGSYSSHHMGREGLHSLFQRGRLEKQIHLCTDIGVRKNLVLHKQIKNRPTLTYKNSERKCFQDLFFITNMQFNNLTSMPQT